MSILDKLCFVLFIWTFLLTVVNPFFENKVLVSLSAACAVFASICYVFA